MIMVFFMGLAWWAFGVLAFVTIVGIPWGRACFVLGKFAFWPFGRDVVARNELYGRHDIGTGPLGTVGNIIWFVLAGIWLAIGHLISAAACGDHYRHSFRLAAYQTGQPGSVAHRSGRGAGGRGPRGSCPPG